MPQGTVQPTIISEDDFESRFQPEECPHSGWKQRDFPEDAEAIQQAMAENRLWTMVEGDNESMALVSGMHSVNRIYHIITQVPYEGDYEIKIL